MFQEPERIIDLSTPIEHDIPVWPTFPPVRIERTSWAARDGFTMEKVEMRTHTATNIDAPLHFIPEGKTLDDFPIDKFMGEGIALDLTPKDPMEAITVDDIAPYESDIREDDVVMLHTEWDYDYGLTDEYLFEFPYLTAEAAQYLAEMKPKAVGTEGASVGGWTEETPAHGPSTDVR